MGKQRGLGLVFLAALPVTPILFALFGGGKAKAAMSVGKEPDYRQALEESKALAIAFNFPRSLLMSILSVESGFNRLATNKNARAMDRGGAWGIGQMTLETAKSMTDRFPVYARKYWPNFDGSGASLLDLKTGMALTAFFLARAWKRYKGDWLASALAYHQGMGTVDRLLKDPRPWAFKLPPNGKKYHDWLVARKPRFDADSPAYA